MKYKQVNQETPKRKFSDSFDEISSLSQSIKARLKFRYMLNKLQRSFFSKQIL